MVFGINMDGYRQRKMKLTRGPTSNNKLKIKKGKPKGKPIKTLPVKGKKKNNK
jgi:hypothetical protein